MHLWNMLGVNKFLMDQASPEIFQVGSFVFRFELQGIGFRDQVKGFGVVHAIESRGSDEGIGAHIIKDEPVSRGDLRHLHALSEAVHGVAGRSPHGAVEQRSVHFLSSGVGEDASGFIFDEEAGV